MGVRKSVNEIISDILTVISSAPAVTLMELHEKTGIRYPTLHRYLELIEKIQNAPKVQKRKSGKNVLYYCESKTIEKK